METAAQTERAQAEREHCSAVARNELTSMELEVESLAAQRVQWAAEHECEESAAAEARAARDDMEVGLGEYCSPRHRDAFEPSRLELSGIL